MPQLDLLTFTSQMFWFTLVFLGFYLIIMRYLLPTLSTLLKIRSKTLTASSKQVNSLEKEESSVISSFETNIINTLVETRQLLTTSTQQSTDWFNNSLKETNEKMLLKVNQEYINTLYQISAKKYLTVQTVKESF